MTKESMIISSLSGGLGNQMFQYAVARALSLQRNVPLVLDVSMLNRDPKRSYALAPFDLEAQIVRLSWWSRLWWKLKGAHYREAGFAYDPRVPDLPSGTLLSGYFQSEKYFSEYADIIRCEFSLKEPLSQKAHVYLRDIESSPFSIAVHVRRGDYVSDPSTTAYHGNCSKEYYENAIRFMRGQKGNANFFFFSDEPDCFVASQVDGVVVSGLSPHEDMFLMSRCKHQIIANSSFSWWGAWLNQNRDKIVVAPKRWFANEKMERQTGDLIPEGWIRL